MKRLALSFLLLTIFGAQAKSESLRWLKDGFSLEVSSPKLNYRLERKKNYVRFQYLGTRLGFFIESCNKPVVTSIDKILTLKIHAFIQESQRVPEKTQVLGSLRINEKDHYIFHDQRMQPSLMDLHTRIYTYMKLAEGLCKK